MVAHRIHHGVALPLPADRAEPALLALEYSPSLPRGYHLRDDMVLIRESDGEALGTMQSVEFACRHAAHLARIEAKRQEGLRHG